MNGCSTHANSLDEGVNPAVVIARYTREAKEWHVHRQRSDREWHREERAAGEEDELKYLHKAKNGAGAYVYPQIGRWWRRTAMKARGVEQARTCAEQKKPEEIPANAWICLVWARSWSPRNSNFDESLARRRYSHREYQER